MRVIRYYATPFSRQRFINKLHIEVLRESTHSVFLVHYHNHMSLNRAAKVKSITGDLFIEVRTKDARPWLTDDTEHTVVILGARK